MPLSTYPNKDRGLGRHQWSRVLSPRLGVASRGVWGENYSPPQSPLGGGGTTGGRKKGDSRKREGLLGVPESCN